MSARETTRAPRAKQPPEGSVLLVKMEWHVTLTTDAPIHQGRKRNDIRFRGARLWYQGTASWSDCHYVYTVGQDRTFRKAIADALPETIRALAKQLDVLPHELTVEGRYEPRGNCPEGLCYRCWLQGERRPSRTYTYTLERPHFMPRTQVFMADFCAEHAEKFNALLL